MERRALYFSRVVESALRLVRSTIGKTIEVRCQLESDRYVIANESQIHQVLLNLCTNAAQAMRSGGVITGGADQRGSILGRSGKSSRASSQTTCSPET